MDDLGSYLDAEGIPVGPTRALSTLQYIERGMLLMHLVELGSRQSSLGLVPLLSHRRDPKDGTGGLLLCPLGR